MKNNFLMGCIMVIISLSLTGCESNKDEKVLNDVEEKYEKFIVYNKYDNAEFQNEINLNDTNDKITTSEQAKLILKREKNGEKTDRQVFLDAWDKLDDKQKSHPEFKEIQKNYMHAKTMLTASNSVLKYYENVKSDAVNIIKDKDKIEKMYDKTDKNLGARGKAYNDYKKLAKYNESEDDSLRMGYLKQKYKDTVNFLECSQLLLNSKTVEAKKQMQKIEDKDLRSIVEKSIAQ